jgi:choline dehydrogenase
MPSFDVVVIGAGTSGATLAGVLGSSSNLNVCLIEAGPDYGALDAGLWPDDLADVRRRSWSHDWGYMRAAPGGQAVLEARARVVGGCSTHNQAAALWGLPEDYDAWADRGNDGWRYADLAPLIDAIECADSNERSPFRGRHGRVVTRPFADDELASWQRTFLDAAVDLGYPRLADLSAPDPGEGVMPFHANIRDKLRWNSAFAFLDPARGRPNLVIRPGLTADRFEVDGDRVVGLMCRDQSAEVRIDGRVFVVAAGVFGSPSVLLRSGIGPADELRRHGIATRVELPGVGANLHDHPGVGIRYEPSADGRQAFDADVAADRLYPSQVVLRARSSATDGPFDLHVLPSQSPQPDGSWSFDLIAFHMRSYSRGTVRLTGTDPSLPPDIDFNFLAGDGAADIPILVDAVHVIRRIADGEPLRSSIARELDPGPAIESEAQLINHVRRAPRTYSHSVGTCRMGPAGDPGAVVDATGRVHGLDNLYVADASIIPDIPRANTNLTCFLIGYKAALELRETLSG